MPDQGLDPGTQIDKDEKGNIKGAHKVGKNGKRNRFTVEKGGDGRAHSYGRINFYEEEESFFHVETFLSTPGRKASFSAQGNNVSWKIDIEFLTQPENNVAATLKGEINGHRFSGNFLADQNKWTFDGLDAAAATLPSDLSEKLKLFQSEIEQGYNQYKPPSKANFTSEGGVDSPSNSLIEGFDWNTAGRMACWGFAGVGGAAVCAFTAGIGCFLGAFGFGAAASFCSDSYY